MSGKMNQHAYENLIAEDLDWLEQYPRTLEREHIAHIVRDSVEHHYPSVEHHYPVEALHARIAALEAERERLKHSLQTADELGQEIMDERDEALTDNLKAADLLNEHADAVATSNRLRAERDALRERLAAAVEELKIESDNAYCRSLDIARTPPCLGWEAKVKAGQFGKPELDAHTFCAHLDGKHRAYSDAIRILAAAEGHGEETP